MGRLTRDWAEACSESMFGCCFDGLDRWWSTTANPEYLSSSASRRDAWLLLLPLPCLLNACMVAHRGDDKLLALVDIVWGGVLFVAAWLPPHLLWSDVCVVLTHGARLAAFCYLSVTVRAYITAPEVLATCSMALAGVHSLCMGAFVAGTWALHRFLHSSWDPEHVLTCAYLVLCTMLVEYRVAMLFSDRRESFGYKALPLATSLQDGYTALSIPTEEETLRARATRNEKATQCEAPGTDANDSTASGPPSPPMSARRGSLGELLPGPSQHSEERRLTEADLHRLAEDELTRAVSTDISTLRDRLLGGGPVDPSKTLGVVKLAGFRHEGLNSSFVECPGSALAVNGRATYWSLKGTFFIFHNPSIDSWGVAQAGRLERIRAAGHHGIAYSPEGFNLEEPTLANPSKGWKEWDPNSNQWTTRSCAGVVMFRKLRPQDFVTAAAGGSGSEAVGVHEN